MEKINWDDILTKFKNRKCSIAEFCKENNIKKYSLYHRRKRAGLLEKTVFHAINVKEEVLPKKKDVSLEGNINIAIGKMNISILGTEKELVVEIIRELSKIC